jgi:hypothetical protein
MALHGTSKAYILDRLQREGRTDFLNAIDAGQITALTAAVELGWVKRPSLMGGSTNQAKRRQHQLRTIADGGSVLGRMQELWLGASFDRGSFFSSREELRAAWETHRDEIMRRWGNHGRRPAGFYEFMWDGPRPAYDVERSTLWRAGLLSETERAQIEAEWRQEFERAHKPDFFHHTGSEVLHGEPAAQAHLRWADVPRELVRRWTAARKRRERWKNAQDASTRAGTVLLK